MIGIWTYYKANDNIIFAAFLPSNAPTLQIDGTAVALVGSKGECIVGVGRDGVVWVNSDLWIDWKSSRLLYGTV